MVWLSSLDPLPARPRRVLVAGTSGSGKSTLARQVAGQLGLPYVEIDALFHGPGWTPRPTFVAEVAELARSDSWSTEWQYEVARDLLGNRADLVVWLDLPRSVVLRQVVRRTVGRRLRRSELWNGNVEPPLLTFFTDPEHIVRWAWSTHGLAGPRLVQLARLRLDLPIVRLRSRRDVRRWLAGPLAASTALQQP